MNNMPSEKLMSKLENDLSVKLKVKDLMILWILMESVEEFVVGVATQAVGATTQIDGKTVVAFNATEALKALVESLKHLQGEGAMGRLNDAIHENGLCEDPDCKYHWTN